MLHQDPVAGFEQLLPCAHQVLALESSTSSSAERSGSSSSGGGGGPTPPDRRQIVLNATVAGMLGLPPLVTATQQQRHQQHHQALGEEGSGDEDGGGAVGVAIDEGGGGPQEGGGEGKAFDVSVLCTAFGDLNVLFDPRHSRVESRLGEALLWNVNVSLQSGKILPNKESESGRVGCACFYITSAERAERAERADTYGGRRHVYRVYCDRITSVIIIIIIIFVQRIPRY